MKTLSEMIAEDEEKARDPEFIEYRKWLDEQPHFGVYDADDFDLKLVDQAIEEKIMGKQPLQIPRKRWSKRMDEAMEVQAKMASRGFCCFKLDCDYTYVFSALFLKEGDHVQTSEEKGKKYPKLKRGIETDGNPALAICLSALREFGFDESFDSLRKKD